MNQMGGGPGFAAPRRLVARFRSALSTVEARRIGNHLAGAVVAQQGLSINRNPRSLYDASPALLFPHQERSEFLRRCRPRLATRSR